MTRRKVDLRFTEVGYELMVLAQYITLLEANLPTVVDAEKRRVWVDLDPDDDADRQIGHHLEDRLDQGVTTRFLAGAAMIATWAIYEATVSQMADYVRDQKEVSLRMSRLKGDFLERARTYYDDVLKFDLHPLGTDWTRLQRLAELRHLIAHANGRLWDVPGEDRKRLESWIKSTAGLSIVGDEYVVVSLDFVRQSHTFVDGLLKDLVDRVRDAF